MLLHILLFDKAYSVTHWINFSETRARLRRRFSTPELTEVEFRATSGSLTTLGLRLQADEIALTTARGALLHQYAPHTQETSFRLMTGGMTLSAEADLSALAAGLYVGGVEGLRVVSRQYAVYGPGVGFLLSFKDLVTATTLRLLAGWDHSNSSCNAAWQRSVVVLQAPEMQLFHQLGSFGMARGFPLEMCRLFVDSCVRGAYVGLELVYQHMQAHRCPTLLTCAQLT